MKSSEAIKASIPTANDILKYKNVSIDDILKSEYPEDILEELIKEGIRVGIKASYDNWRRDHSHPAILGLLSEIK